MLKRYFTNVDNWAPRLGAAALVLLALFSSVCSSFADGRDTAFAFLRPTTPTSVCDIICSPGLERTGHVKCGNFNTAAEMRTGISRAGMNTRLNGLFGGLFGGDNTDGGSGSKVVFEIPAKDVKVGALRFLLQIYLVGVQNNPEPNSWLLQQGEDDSVINIYYKDGTGMVSIILQEYGIKATRNGQRPSLQYQLQESVLLHGVLDELNNVTFDMEDIEEEKRLIRLSDESAIDKARAALPTRKA